MCEAQTSLNWYDLDPYDLGPKPMMRVPMHIPELPADMLRARLPERIVGRK